MQTHTLVSQTWIDKIFIPLYLYISGREGELCKFTNRATQTSAPGSTSPGALNALALPCQKVCAYLSGNMHCNYYFTMFQIPKATYSAKYFSF